MRAGVEWSGVTSRDSSTDMSSVTAASWQDETVGAQLCSSQDAKEAAALEGSMNTSKEQRRD